MTAPHSPLAQARTLEPDLAARHSLRQVASEGPVHPQQFRGCVIALCRLSDQAVCDLRAMMDCVDRQVQGTGVHLRHWWRAIAHLEHLVNSLHRSARIIGRVRGLGFVDVDGGALFPKAPPTRLAAPKCPPALTRWRDAFEHLDERLISDDDDAPLMKSDAAHWLKRSLAYTDLGSWVMQLRDISEGLAATQVHARKRPV